MILHPEVEAWFLLLCRSDPASADLVSEAIDLLAEHGPALGRPLVDRLKSSSFHQAIPGTPDQSEGSATMTGGADWRDVKAKAREIDPEWEHPERVARREELRERMLAKVSGAQLAEIRKQLGLTQTQLAEAAGLSQARISQIENGQHTSLESLRAYVTGLGGHLDVVARIGNIRLDVA
ncbi:helix-turn-helix domain-containing protein [Micromonospora carbonacea]|nr:helix-turn-helix domain-containing protein [Micromonospora carbonacea]